jgi:hypothetical protein
MCFYFYETSRAYFAANPIWNALAHSAGGFGLALVLQHYIKGAAFLPPWIGWALIVFSAVIHVRSFMKK